MEFRKFFIKIFILSNRNEEYNKINEKIINNIFPMRYNIDLK